MMKEAQSSNMKESTIREWKSISPEGYYTFCNTWSTNSKSK